MRFPEHTFQICAQNTLGNSSTEACNITKVGEEIEKGRLETDLSYQRLDAINKANSTDYVRGLDLKIDRDKDLSPDAQWLLELLLVGFTDLATIEPWAQREGVDFPKAYDELKRQGLIIHHDRGVIDLPYQYVPRNHNNPDQT